MTVALSNAAWANDSHRLAADTALRFAQREIAPNDARWRQQHRVDPQTWRMAGELGLLLSDVPEEFGGGGGDFGHDAMIYSLTRPAPPV